MASGVKTNGSWLTWAVRISMGLFVAWAIQDRVAVGRDLNTLRADVRELQTQVRIYHGARP